MLDTYALSNTLTETEIDGGVTYTHANGNTLTVVGEYDNGEAWLTRKGVEQHYYYERGDDAIQRFFIDSANSVKFTISSDDDAEIEALLG